MLAQTLEFFSQAIELSQTIDKQINFKHTTAVSAYIFPPKTEQKPNLCDFPLLIPKPHK